MNACVGDQLIKEMSASMSDAIERDGPLKRGCSKSWSQ